MDRLQQRFQGSFERSPLSPLSYTFDPGEYRFGAL